MAILALQAEGARVDLWFGMALDTFGRCIAETWLAVWVRMAILAGYFGVLGILAVYGMHRLALVVSYLRSSRREAPAPPPLPDPLPLVTVQCPVFNEREVAPRLVRAVAALDWPRDRLEIQVLDDSTDATAAILEDLVGELRSAGVRIVHLRRTERSVYKSGALQEGLRAAEGEFIAIFDAYFVPPPDFLRRLLPFFADPINILIFHLGLQ